MKKETEKLIYEIVRREFGSVQGASKYRFEVEPSSHRLIISREYLGRKIEKSYSGKELLKLIKLAEGTETWFSVLVNELSFKNNPETDEEREARLGF